MTCCSLRNPVYHLVCGWHLTVEVGALKLIIESATSLHYQSRSFGLHFSLILFAFTVQIVIKRALSATDWPWYDSLTIKSDLHSLLAALGLVLWRAVNIFLEEGLWLWYNVCFFGLRHLKQRSCERRYTATLSALDAGSCQAILKGEACRSCLLPSVLSLLLKIHSVLDGLSICGCTRNHDSIFKLNSSADTYVLRALHRLRWSLCPVIFIAHMVWILL